MPMRATRLAVVLAMALSIPSALAAPGDNKDFTPAPSGAATPVNTAFDEGRRAIDGAQWQVAIAAFERALATQPNDANAYNYLGYANRKLGKYELAFANYNKALAIDPEHKGAHEYIGEAYLE